jgi:hypothetical protein
VPIGPYSGNRPNLAQDATGNNDMWTLSAGSAGQMGRALEIRATGQAAATTPMQSRVVRPTTAGVTPTTGTPGKSSPNAPANSITFAIGWSTQPVLPASGTGDLLNESWNAYGGLLRWWAGQNEEMYLANGVLQNQISFRGIVGTGTGSFSVIWEEF